MGPLGGHGPDLATGAGIDGVGASCVIAEIDDPPDHRRTTFDRGARVVGPASPAVAGLQRVDGPALIPEVHRGSLHSRRGLTAGRDRSRPNQVPAPHGQGQEAPVTRVLSGVRVHGEQRHQHEVVAQVQGGGGRGKAPDFALPHQPAVARVHCLRPAVVVDEVQRAPVQHRREFQQRLVVESPADSQRWMQVWGTLESAVPARVKPVAQPLRSWRVLGWPRRRGVGEAEVWM